MLQLLQLSWWLPWIVFSALVQRNSVPRTRSTARCILPKHDSFHSMKCLAVFRSDPPYCGKSGKLVGVVPNASVGDFPELKHAAARKSIVSMDERITTEDHIYWSPLSPCIQWCDIGFQSRESSSATTVITCLRYHRTGYTCKQAFPARTYSSRALWTQRAAVTMLSIILTIIII